MCFLTVTIDVCYNYLLLLFLFSIKCSTTMSGQSEKQEVTSYIVAKHKYAGNFIMFHGFSRMVYDQCVMLSECFFNLSRCRLSKYKLASQFIQHNSFNRECVASTSYQLGLQLLVIEICFVEHFRLVFLGLFFWNISAGLTPSIPLVNIQPILVLCNYRRIGMLWCFRQHMLACIASAAGTAASFYVEYKLVADCIIERREVVKILES